MNTCGFPIILGMRYCTQCTATIQYQAWAWEKVPGGASGAAGSCPGEGLKPHESWSLDEVTKDRATLEAKYGHKLALPVIARRNTTVDLDPDDEVVEVDDDDTRSVAGSDRTEGGTPSGMFFGQAIRGVWGKLNRNLNGCAIRRAKWCMDNAAGEAFRKKCFANGTVYPCRMTKMKVDNWMAAEFASSEYIEASKTFHLLRKWTTGGAKQRLTSSVMPSWRTHSWPPPLYCSDQIQIRLLPAICPPNQRL